MNADERRSESEGCRFLSSYLRVSAFICGSIVVLVGCAPKSKTASTHPVTVEARQPMSLDEAMRLIEARESWAAHPGINVPRHPAERFLKGMTICVDPGHGGTDGGQTSTRPAGYKAGPAGEKEAFMNLRVGLLLERLLADAGANVVMTRRGDDTVSLRRRAEIANDATRADGSGGADVFVSIHHNAGGGPTNNYTSVWYHGPVDDNEPDLDVARYIALELGRAIRTQVAKTSPIFSSQLMYDSGFGVLRWCDVPGVLVECSFFSAPDEEQRLRDSGYNLREAYAIYVALCEWAYAGRPTQTVPAVVSQDDAARLTTTLDEGLPPWWGADRSRILSSSVRVTFDGRPIPHEFDPLSRKVTASLPINAMRGEHVVTVHHMNMLKNSNWPQRYLIRDGKASPLGARRPTRQPASRPKPLPAATRQPATTQAATHSVAE